MAFIPAYGVPTSRGFQDGSGIICFRGFTSDHGPKGASGGTITITPSDFRLETAGPGAVQFYWTANNINIAKFYHSTDAINYYASTIDNTLTTASETAIELGLLSGTLYYYKMSFDNGLSFSSVVTVVTLVTRLPRGRVQQVGFNAYDN